MDQGSAVGKELARALDDEGWQVVPVRVVEKPASPPEPAAPDALTLAADDEAGWGKSLQDLTARQGPIVGLIQLPLETKYTPKVLFAEEPEHTQLRHIFLLAKHLAPFFEKSSGALRCFFMAVTRLDGQLGLSGQLASSPLTGGVCGLVKTLRREWPAVYCRALDVSADLAAESVAQAIIAELHDPDASLIEVGRTAQQRVTIATEAAAPPAPAPTQAQPAEPRPIFLVSGGGRGITAQAVIELARRTRGTFLLLGRTAMEPESAWAQGCDDPRELQQRFLNEAKARQAKVTPMQIRTVLAGIHARREIAATLQAVQAAGGQAVYQDLDVTDQQITRRQLPALIQTYGPVTGLIHGAGVLADKRLADKSARDFESVYAAKITGLRNLLDCVDVARLRQVVLFSSVAAFYGNAGQADYAMANEILNKWAHEVQRLHPAIQVVSFNWGPWDGGMVTPELKQVLADRHVRLIPPGEGARIMAEYLEPGGGHQAQLVVGDPLPETPHPAGPAPALARIQCTVNLVHNPFLNDHVLGANPVLPMVCALLRLANAAEQVCPGFRFAEATQLQVLKGLTGDDLRQQTYMLELKQEAADTADVRLVASLASTPEAGPVRFHYQAHLVLTPTLSAPPVYPVTDLTEDPEWRACDPYRNRTLFHGPAFQGIQQVLRISPEKLTLRCRVPDIAASRWGQFPPQAFQPAVADTMLQGMLIWERHFHQTAGLPLGCQRWQQYQPIPPGTPFYITTEIRANTAIKLVADVTAYSATGQVYMRMEAVEVALNRQLNRTLFIPAKKAELDRILPFWDRQLGVSRWFGEALFTALFRRFAGQIRMENEADFQALRGQPRLYIANHQVALESVLFAFALSGLGDSLVRGIAKMEHRQSWMSQFLKLIYSYPGITDPELLFYFDRADQASMLKLLAEIKQVVTRQHGSVMVHVQGTRALSAREPVTQLSSVFVDFAIELGMPIVPVKFTGGLPGAPLPERTDFPVGYTYQDYWIGTALPAAMLKDLPFAGRKQILLERLNQLGGDLATAEANPPDPYFAQAVSEWRARHGVPEVQAVFCNVLQDLDPAIPEIRTLWEALQAGGADGFGPAQPWWSGFHRWLSA